MTKGRRSEGQMEKGLRRLRIRSIPSERDGTILASGDIKQREATDDENDRVIGMK
jgi:hypothetical protein